jgi:hypothetical protein
VEKNENKDNIHPRAGDRAAQSGGERNKFTTEPQRHGEEVKPPRLADGEKYEEYVEATEVATVGILVGRDSCSGIRSVVRRTWMAHSASVGRFCFLGDTE